MDEMKRGFDKEIQHLREEVQNLKNENEQMKAEIESLKEKKGKQKRESVPADLFSVSCQLVRTLRPTNLQFSNGSDSYIDVLLQYNIYLFMNMHVWVSTRLIQWIDKEYITLS